MKPRLRFWGNVWSCTTFVKEFPYLKAGYGYTAKEAYDDWAAQ